LKKVEVPKASTNHLVKPEAPKEKKVKLTDKEGKPVVHLKTKSASEEKPKAASQERPKPVAVINKELVRKSQSAPKEST